MTMRDEPSGEAGRRGFMGPAAVSFGLVLMLILAVPRPSAAESGLEEFNRWAFEVNRDLERVVVRPGAEHYERRLPDRIKVWLANAFRNLNEPVTATAHAIGGDFRSALSSSMRFAVNSTLGIGGAVDFARAIELPERRKSFTEAVCRSGLPVGAFMVLPVIGPTTTGVAAAAGALMVGSTYALSLVSVELALLSLADDFIVAAAALRHAVTEADGESTNYRDHRRRFVDGLNELCGPS